MQNKGGIIQLPYVVINKAIASNQSEVKYSLAETGRQK